ncbi:MAG TPA: D-tyrosyl-tRNA(Tyr) deacylase [Clostridiaceae bacterium]|nr:D-tyrosyl-tRNA(Tyr) deacylase [Clostridiaceae bacterium]
MRALIQRVSSAHVEIEEQIVGSIGQGFVILLGVGREDDSRCCAKLWHKINNLRLFEDDEGKTNLNLDQVAGEVLIISQFTLFADCKKGNRPSFYASAPPEQGELLYDQFVALARASLGNRVATGKFGASMDVHLVNHGPFTIWLDTEDL